MATAPGINVTLASGFKPDAVTPVISFNTIYVFGSASTGSKNTPVEIPNVAQFTSIFGASGSTASLDYLFRVFPSAAVQFIRCEDPAITAPIQTGVLDKAHLVYALNQVFPLTSGFAIAPEFFNRQTAQADCTALATALNNWCVKNDLVCVVDTMSDTDSIAELNTYVDAVVAANANSDIFIYYPYIQYGINKIPPSVLECALAMSDISRNTRITSGAGVESYSVDLGAPVVKVFDATDVSAIATKNVNPIRLFPGGGYAVYDILTLNGVKTFPQRVAECITKKALNASSLLFRLMDPTGNEISRLQAELSLVMQQLDTFGCFSTGDPDQLNEGLPATEKYAILQPTFNSLTQTLNVNILVRFVNAIRIANISLQIIK